MAVLQLRPEFSESLEQPTPRPTRFPAAKYAAPNSAANQLLRPRLQQLIEGAGAVKLILIRAAAGFGKTTLLEQYGQHCRETGRKTLWITLDIADNDPQRFLRVLDEGLRPLLLQQGEAATETDADTLLGLIMTAPEPFSILLDELEAIQNADVLAFLQQLVEALPAGCTLALTSRATPTIGLGRLRARGQVLEIKPADLRFSIEETGQFLRDKRGLALSDTDLTSLYHRTEGWITGLYLASLSLKERHDPTTFIASFSGSNLELAEYLTEDILSRLDEDTRSFLLHTSVPAQFNASLCDALTGRSDSRSILERLERANLFLSPADNQQQWFRYHPLFASFLRHALERQHPGRERELHHLAAQWFLTAGQAIPGILHLFSANLLDEAADRIAEHLEALVGSGRTRLLLRWLDSLPTETRERHSDVSLVYTWLLATAGRLQEAMRVAARLVSLHGQAYAYVPEAMHCLQLGNTDQADECCRIGIDLLDRLPANETNLYVVLASCVATNLVARGHYDKAHTLLSEAFRRNTRIGESFLGDTFGMSESILDLIQGRLTHALVRLQTLRENPHATTNGRPNSAVLSLDVIYSVLLHESGALAEAGKILERRLSFAKQVGAPDILIVSHVLSARLALGDGDRAAWMRHLVELEQIGQAIGSARTQCSAWLERTRVAILEGRLDTATEALHMADQHGQWDQPDMLKYANDADTPRIARQRLRIAQGRSAEAVEALGTMIVEARHRQHHRREIKLHILQAIALEGMNRYQPSLDALNLALRLASHEGFLQTFIEEGKPMADLFRRWVTNEHGKMKTHGIEPGFVDLLLRRLGVAQPVASTASRPEAEGAREVLTEREFQILQLLAAGHRNKVIADKVFLSEFTVKSHLQKIYAKLDARGRTEALAIARGRGWIN